MKVSRVVHVLTFTLTAGEWSASRIGHFNPQKKSHDTHWSGGWEGPRFGLDDMEKNTDHTGTQIPAPWSCRPQSVTTPKCYPDSATTLCIVISFLTRITILFKEDESTNKMAFMPTVGQPSSRMIFLICQLDKNSGMLCF
jgi:hypothetical protein